MTDLQEKLRTWLDSQGYPLEMVVAQAFRKQQFRVFESEYYQDTASGAFRETDVRATIQCEIHDFLVRVGFVVECKLSKDKPWVLFTTAKTIAGPGRVSQRAASRLGRWLLMQLGQNSVVQDLPIFQLPNRCAYGMTQAFTSGSDVTYSAAMSVGKAADAEAQEYYGVPEVENRLCEIVLPVIVIDAPLFEAYLDPGGEVKLNQLQSGTLLWRNRTCGMPHTIISVLTKDAIDGFVADAAQSITRLFVECEGPLQALRANQVVPQTP